MWTSDFGEFVGKSAPELSGDVTIGHKNGAKISVVGNCVLVVQNNSSVSIEPEVMQMVWQEGECTTGKLVSELSGEELKKLFPEAACLFVRVGKAGGMDVS